MDRSDSTEESAFERGAAMMRRVYGDAIPVPPEGTMAFSDVMVRSLFAEVWDRDVLSIRDRRLLLMGVVAACGATDVWASRYGRPSTMASSPQRNCGRPW